MPLDVQSQFTCLGHNLILIGGWGEELRRTSIFHFFLIKHDNVTINNHALLYCWDPFQRKPRVGEKGLNPDGETKVRQSPSMLCHRAILYIVRAPRRGSTFLSFALFNHKNRSRHQRRPLVTITWLFLKLFTVNIHGVQSDPENQHPSFGSGWKPGGAVS